MIKLKINYILFYLAMEAIKRKPKLEYVNAGPNLLTPYKISLYSKIFSRVKIRSNYRHYQYWVFVERLFTLIIGTEILNWRYFYGYFSD